MKALPAKTINVLVNVKYCKCVQSMCTHSLSCRGDDVQCNNFKFHKLDIKNK